VRMYCSDFETKSSCENETLHLELYILWLCIIFFFISDNLEEKGRGCKWVNDECIVNYTECGHINTSIYSCSQFLNGQCFYYNYSTCRNRSSVTQCSDINNSNQCIDSRVEFKMCKIFLL
jgi:hypothetical protein